MTTDKTKTPTLEERAKAEFAKKYGHHPTLEAQAMAAMLDTLKAKKEKKP